MKNKDQLAILLIIVVAFVIYGNTFSNDFVLDDLIQITKNVHVTSFDVSEIFSSSISEGGGTDDNFYRPIVGLSFAIEYKLWGASPAGFHFTNLIIHILSAILIYIIFSSLQSNKVISFLTSLLFLIHPLQVESVTYISGRTELLPVFFSLLSLYLFIGAYKNLHRRTLYYIFSFISFILALLSKESVAIFPLLLPIVYFAFINRSINKDSIKNILYKTLPFLTFAIVYMVLRFTVLSFGEGTIGSSDLNIFTRSFVFLKVLMIYWGILIFPINLRFRLDQSLPSMSFDLMTLLSVLILIGIVYVSILSIKRKRTSFFGFSWFFINILPASGVLIPIIYILGERWLRMPSIGIFYLMSVGIVNILRTIDGKKYIKNIFMGIFVIYFIFLAYGTVTANTKWKDSIVFYEYMLEFYPEAAGISMNLANAYDSSGDEEKAFLMYKRTLEIDPSLPTAHANLGNYYEKAGQYDLAIEEYEKAIEINGQFVYALSNIAKVHVILKQYDEAIYYLNIYQNIYPNSWKPYSLMGQTYMLREDYNKAREYFKKALDLSPEESVPKEMLKIVEALLKVDP